MTTASNEIAKVLTANDLLGGHVVFYTANGTWSADLKDALLAKTPEAAAEFDRLATSREVEALTASAYVVEVRRKDNGSLTPLKLREEIRMAGPTIEIGDSVSSQSSSQRS